MWAVRGARALGWGWRGLIKGRLETTNFETRGHDGHVHSPFLYYLTTAAASCTTAIAALSIVSTVSTVPSLAAVPTVPSHPTPKPEGRLHTSPIYLTTKAERYSDSKMRFGLISLALLTHHDRCRLVWAEPHRTGLSGHLWRADPDHCSSQYQGQHRRPRGGPMVRVRELHLSVIQLFLTRAHTLSTRAGSACTVKRIR